MAKVVDLLPENGVVPTPEDEEGAIAPFMDRLDDRAQFLHFQDNPGQVERMEAQFTSERIRSRRP